MMPKRTKDGMPDFGGMPGRDGKPDQNESTNPDRQQDPNRPELWATTAGAQRNRLKDFLKDVGYDVSPKPKPQPDPGPSPQPGPNNPVNPITPDLNVVIGNNKAQAGDFSGAEHSFTDALDSDPSNIDALNGRGQVRLRMGDNLGAADDARAVLGQDSGNGTARETLRYATKQLGDEMNAPKAANPWEGQNGGQAAQLAGGQLRIFGAGRGARSPLEAESALLSQQAWQLLRVRDYDRARGLLDRALALDAGNPDALTRRAALNIATGRYGEALRDALAALEASPARARGPAKQIASEFARRGHYKESKALALALLRQDPKDASAHFALARAEYGLGNRAATLQQLQEAASLDPAAYRAKFEAARAAGNDEDLTFLFDDAAGTQPQGGASARQPASRGRGFWWTVVATLVGGLLVALGLLHAAGAPVAERLTTGFRSLTGAGAEPEAADGAPAVEAERAPPDGDITVAGRVIGNYELVRQIGLGGMGIVYEAMDRSLGRRVAVKKMREEIRVDPRERERFLKEARTVAGLKHPSIVEIHAVVEDSDDVYLVFEYVSGTTLYELLDRRGKLGLAEAAGLVEKIGKALVYAHARGVIHRDLKPSNVMLDEEGTVKVMDFGVARQAKDAATKLSMTGTVVGTPPYMAPEQEQGMVCRESDVYALAVCFYELITGRLPFQGSGAGMLLSKMNKTYAPASTLAPELPAAVEELMAKAL
ncbi:MAG: protein kinase [Elusimicrobia bacterium]|nr:protein kinase [Elusimicrobiota bacterium]